MKTPQLPRLVLLAALALLLGACSGKTDDPQPTGQTSQDALPRTFTSTLAETTKSLEYDAQGRLTKATVTTGTYKDQYNYWEYEATAMRFGYGIPPATKRTVIQEYKLKDGLPIESNTGPEWVISNAKREFNFKFDSEKHLLGYEYEFRRQSTNALVEAMRIEYTWQGGNMVRMKRFNAQTGQLSADITYEYDLTRPNRLFSGFAIDRPLLGLENPASALPIHGLGVKNIFVRSYPTGGTPGKPYSYAFDNQNRITSITTPSGGYVLSLTY